MKKNAYHSGVKLQHLREIKGLKENELAEELQCSVDDILAWENNGFPKEQLSNVLEFFEITSTFFDMEVLDDSMLKKLASCELKRSALDQELQEKLDSYSENPNGNVDLSSLGLIEIPETIFTLVNIQQIDLSDNLLVNISEKLQLFIDGGGQLNIDRNFLSSSLPTTYNIAHSDSINTITNSQSTRVAIRILQVKLEHIGIYSDLSVDFNDDLTVLIGVNGAGKTTILKAISLVILGPRESINIQASSLRSVGIDKRINSKVTLKVLVAGQEYTNQVVLQHNADTGDIDVLGQPFADIFDNHQKLKNLILCIGEQRNSFSSLPKDDIEKYPRILDLLPFLRGDSQSCIRDFSSWWANLENSKIRQPDDQNTINLCFDIFSKFMGETIQSAGLRKIKPKPELWVKYDNGKEVPLDLASQGYQTVMGWVGFIIQRMVEANQDYPLPLSQPSIVMIDEIDQLLSVKWQQKILTILRGFFPHTQWIVSTHSPMVLSDLNKHQVVQLQEREGEFIAQSNEVDLWMWQYGDIIRQFFEITTTPPKYQQQVLSDEITSMRSHSQSTENNQKLCQLEEKLAKVRASAAAADRFEAQLQSLQRREQQLVELMESLKGA